ncbi:T9SS type A sorting domain-containing protein [Hymenobacter terrenus]|uniref:T9SS type A sorting domain-containing protein n=1 Tax=Hymenobacter terrenus TaxID=1629124 RepID=UPI000A567EDB|nr:T9SS type A sorting domain-containing protein [Hymenobacter terrenus]
MFSTSPFSFGKRQVLGLLLGAPISLLASTFASAQAPAWQSAVALTVTDNPSASFSRVGVKATATDASGNLYLIGSFEGTATFGSTSLTSAGLSDVFVAKWNPTTSSFLWARQAGGTGADYAGAVAVSGTNVYVVGEFSGSSANFGSINLTTAGVAGSSDAFITKLTDAGTSASFAWAQSAGGNGVDAANAVAVSGTNVYVAGSFASGTARFGISLLANAEPTSTPNADAFITKLTDAGTSASFAWAQAAGGTGIDGSNAIAVSGTNVYVAGKFSNPTANFGTVVLTSRGFDDAFVAKLTDAGATASFAWAEDIGGSSSDNATALAVSGLNVFLTGSFVGTATFGSVALTSTGNSNVFVAKFADASSAATLAWVRQAGGSGPNSGRALAVSGANVYVAGDFSGSPSSFGSTSLNSIGASDAFVSKLVDAGTTSSFSWAQRAGGGNADVARTLALSGTRVYVAGGFAGASASFGTITLTNPNPIGGASFVASISDAAPLASASAAQLVGVSLWPNPARENATLRIPAVPGAAQASLILTDALGRVLRTQAVALPATTTVPLTNLAPGLYALRIQAADQQTTQKFVVE